MSEIAGYARASSTGQSLDIQLAKLRAAGCTRVWTDECSGHQATSGPELQACLSYIRQGDTLVITRLDRMARSALDLAKIADELQRKQVALRVTDQGIDTATPGARQMFNLLRAFADFETDIRREHQQEGIAAAKQKGVCFGRRQLLTPDEIQEIRRLKIDGNLTAAQLSKRFGVGRATIYRALQVETVPD